jgi:Uma2 family endonuclease
MAMAALLRQFTVEDVDAFPDDGNRYEVLNGVLLVTPGPGLPHQTIASELGGELWSFLKDERGIQVWNPATIRIPPTIHLEPDILVARMPKIPDWEAVTEHWLAVEISGVGSRMYDREYKRDAYLQLGVKEVWLVDLDERCVFVSPDIPALFRSLPR